MKIAITGPTGNIGRRIVQELKKKGGHELLLLARDPKKLAAEQARGAKVIQGDLDDAAYVKQATQGVEALFFMIPPNATADDFRGYQRHLAKNAAEAARANKIGHVVFLSSIGAHLGRDTGLVNGLHDAEEELRKTAKNLTILRPAFFMENFMNSLPTIRQAQTVYMPIDSSIRIPMIATRDIADRAVDELINSAPRGQRVLPLHGPKEYSFAEATAAIGQAWGQEVKYIKVGPDQIREALRGMGASKSFTELALEMYENLQSGKMRDEYPRSSETTTPTTWEIFAREQVLPALQRLL